MNCINNQYNNTPAFCAKTGPNLEKFIKESYKNRPRKLEQFENQKFNLDMAGFDDYTIECYQGYFTRKTTLVAYKNNDSGNKLILKAGGHRRDVLQEYLNLDTTNLSQRLNNAKNWFEHFNKPAK